MAENQKLITELTKEQEALIPVYRDKWIAIGTCTEAANRKLAEAGMVEAYKKAEVKEPTVILWGNSPLQGARLASLVRDGKLDKELEEWGKKAKPGKPYVPNKKEHEKLYAMAKELKGKKIEPINCGYGCHDANWLGFYDYFREVIGIKECERLSGLTQLAQNAGWWWAFTDVAILTERPNRLCRDPQSRLHSGDGPAISWPDGFAVYLWHGVIVPKHLIMNPETIKVKDILAENNAEVRRVMLDRFGLERWILESNAAPIHTDEFGALYEMTYPDNSRQRFVVVLNGTKEADGTLKKYILNVPSDVNKALDAVAWTFSMDPKEYARLACRT